jgi:uncharacterized coiled-coil protein SlyX
MAISWDSPELDEIRALNARVGSLTDLSLQSYLRLEKIMAALDALAQQVADQKTVVDSVLALVQGLADKLVQAGTDEVKLQALVDELKSQDAALAAAVAANTPAEVPPTE